VTREANRRGHEGGCVQREHERRGRPQRHHQLERCEQEDRGRHRRGGRAQQLGSRVCDDRRARRDPTEVDELNRFEAQREPGTEDAGPLHDQRQGGVAGIAGVDDHVEIRVRGFDEAVEAVPSVDEVGRARRVPACGEAKDQPRGDHGESDDRVRTVGERPRGCVLRLTSLSEREQGGGRAEQDEVRDL
jgi:hypothetical protein